MTNIFHDFSKAPANLDIQRSVFKRDSGHQTTTNLGTFTPIYIDEMVPGDTFKIKTSMVARMTSLTRPIFGNINMDIYYFFVPMRLIWKHWKEFNGENNTNAWTKDAPSYSIPQITAPKETGWEKGTLADHLGLPIKKYGFTVSALPFRALTLIYNEWFRDENVQRPMLFDDGDTGGMGTNGKTYSDMIKGGICPQVNKYHDYFTSALPAPQKGDPVTVSLAGQAPLNTRPANDENNVTFISGNELAWKTNKPTAGGNTYGDIGTGGPALAGKSPLDSQASTTNNVTIIGTNMYADLTNVSVITINALRTAFQIQKILEADARSGTRYVEILKQRFGVTCPDYRLQRPEYLGGKRTPIMIQQVAQTSETTANSPQGNLTAYSQTNDSSESFVYSAQEFGYVIGIAVARQEHVYSQGINKMWSRKTIYDFYQPKLANIGEQPILKKEIFYTDRGSAVNEQVFGYQEAWAEMRYKPNMVTGMLRPDLGAQGLENYSIADKYTNAPTISEEFTLETPDYLDRALAVDHTKADQFILDFYFDCTARRPMPVYSTPGLIDHH
nr:major head protein [Microvirus sp.]